MSDRTPQGYGVYMDTSTPQLSNRIAAVVVTRFANENGIEPSHLLTAPADLTPVELLSATRALGLEIFA